MRACKIWLFENSYIEMNGLLPKSLCDFYAIKPCGNGVMETAIRIEPIETISSEAAIERMKELVIWRGDYRGQRKLILFVPKGLKPMARTILAEYDEVFEYQG